MTWQIVGIIAALIAFLFIFKLLAGRGGKLSRHPYQKHVALFSADDRAFFLRLKESMGDEYEIFGKIRADDIIIPKQGVYPEGGSPIAGWHFDFVLCDKQNLAVACAIQLHDKTQADRHAEPDPLQAICGNLGLPWVRFQVKADYSVGEIRQKLQQAMAKEPFYYMETDGRKEPRISNIEDMKF